MSWTAVSGATGYEWRYRGSWTNTWSAWNDNGSSRSKTITGLVSRSTYYFQVRAKNTDRIGPASTQKSGQISSFGAGVSGINLKEVVPFPSGVYVAWLRDAAAAPEGDESRYRVSGGAWSTWLQSSDFLTGTPEYHEREIRSLGNDVPVDIEIRVRQSQAPVASLTITLTATGRGATTAVRYGGRRQPGRERKAVCLAR